MREIFEIILTLAIIIICIISLKIVPSNKIFNYSYSVEGYTFIDIYGTEYTPHVNKANHTILLKPTYTAQDPEIEYAE